MKRGTSFYLLCALLAASLAACVQAPAAEPEARILYFIHRTDAEPVLLVPGRLRAALGAQAVGEWGDLMVLHASQPAEAVIIDGASVAQVNAEDVARLYRQCVVLAFSICIPQKCRAWWTTPAWPTTVGWMASEPYPSDFFIIVHRRARTEQQSCAADALPSELTGLGKGRSQYSLASEEDFGVFVGVLTTDLNQPQP